MLCWNIWMRPEFCRVSLAGMIRTRPWSSCESWESHLISSVSPARDSIRKALSVQTIAQKLNIGLDTIAFLDDNEFELREIEIYFFPQVARYHAWSDRNSLMEAVGQEGTGTAESRNRRVFMQAQEKRDQEELKFSGTREEFLRDCAMRLTIREAREDDLARVCELVERSSQYKTFSQTVDPDFCRRYRASTQSKLWVAELEDRFGQYGIIGVCFLRSGDGNVWIDQFCISCRVGGRGIGVVFLQTVLDQCQGMGNPCFKAVCCFAPTKRNRPVVILLRTLGFRKSQSQDGQGGLEVALPVAHVACDWITIIVDKGCRMDGAKGIGTADSSLGSPGAAQRGGTAD